LQSGITGASPDSPTNSVAPTSATVGTAVKKASAVGGLFGVVGLVVLALFAGTVIVIVRRRRRDAYERHREEAMVAEKRFRRGPNRDRRVIPSQHIPPTISCEATPPLTHGPMDLFGDVMSHPYRSGIRDYVEFSSADVFPVSPTSIRTTEAQSQLPREQPTCQTMQRQDLLPTAHLSQSIGSPTIWNRPDGRVLKIANQ